ncbi:trehalose-phosphatase [Martelella sp. FLE1502]
MLKGTSFSSGDISQSLWDLRERFHAEPDCFALFFDIDGTLLDLAPTPDSVVAPEGLSENLAALSDRTAGALALLTGRSIAFADKLFSPHQFALAGLHGAQLRYADGTYYATKPSRSFDAAKALLKAQRPEPEKVIFEDKGAAVALHYRLAPDLAPTVKALMKKAARVAGGGWQIQHGKMVIELRPAMANKGEALKCFMKTPIFKGRLPVAVGDDLTDEDMFIAAKRMGGTAIRIGHNIADTAADMVLPSPFALRACLRSVAGSRSQSGRQKDE